MKSTTTNRSEGISVIIVTYNSERHVAKCISTLRRYWPGGLPLEIIVLDNNSRDATVEKINKFKQVKLIKNRKNVGFAKAVNLCLKRCKYKKVILVNPDTFFYRNSISQLLLCAWETEAGILGGKMLRLDRSVHGTFVRFPNFWTALFEFSNLQKIFPNNRWHRSFYHSDVKPDTCLDVDAVSGGYMFIDRNKIGNGIIFDENFFMYLEDIDFCFRAKVLGARVVYCPESVITHIGGASSNNRHKINLEAWDKARRYYFWKHIQFPLNIIVLAIFAIDKIAINFLKVFRSYK